MIKNYLKIAWRQVLKNRLISFINVLGLGLGLTIGIFIFLYVQHETSYDKWIPESENIYRVFRPYNNGADGNLSTPIPVARAMREEIPGVVSAARLNGAGDQVIEWKNQFYTIPNVSRVDSTFFQTIPLQFEYGNVKTTFDQIDIAVLSQKTARRIFGKINPVGESVLLGNSHLIKIAGVLSPPAGATHLETDMYIIEKMEEGYWTGGGGRTYVRLSPSTKTETVEQTLFEVAKKGITQEYIEDGDDVSEAHFPLWALQPISDIHLQSQHLGETGLQSGNPWQITLMILIGILILFLAGINYVNLATAQMSVRAKEIGIRNVAGANRSQLITQFLTETLVITFCALVIAIFLSNFLLPFFNEVVSRPISFSTLWAGWSPFLVVGLALFTGLITGVFPALYFSKIQPSSSLKSQFFNNKKTSVYRNTLIVSQFAMAIGLVLFATLVWQQVDYMMKKDLGFEKEQIAIFSINEEKTMENFSSKKHRFQQIPGISGVTQISRHPGSFIPNYDMEIQGIAGNKSQVNILFGDLDWNSTFQIPLKAGRFFSKNYPTDTSSAFVVNETFVKKFGIENPIGHQMKFRGDEKYSTIIGVLEDFHYKGLQSNIEPVAVSAKTSEAWMSSIAVRFEANNITTALASFSKQWQNLEPTFPVNYSFLDEEFAKQYESYQHFGRSITYATILCFFIALIGLFGLTIFIVQRKTKEIGIRKVLGASVVNIVQLLSKDFLKLVVISFVIAAPVALYFINGWLENFAYRQEIQWWIFLLVGLLTIGLVFITVSLHSIRAAIANPVESIRNE